MKIAVVGMSCRFPGSVTSLDEFWNLLRSERDAVTEIPPDRFGTDFYWHPSRREPGKSYTFAAGVLDDVAGFDAAFFGISPREARQMDPQQRLLLELAWEAFEDAGVRPVAMRGRQCGVYVGVESPDYTNRHMDDLSLGDPYSSTGGTLSIASNRVSYLFDLRGPSMSVNTACSSSLVALHQAVQALQTGEADCALAGGINLLMHPFGFIGFSKASMLSPRGRCRAFDATGDGYVRAEGGAFVLLKPLDKALADGDAIHAVIAGSGVNSDGYTQGGISVPGAATQAALLRQVYARAGVDVRTLAYLEAHGTGTAVGDPIETRALGEVAAAGRAEDDPLLIGSVKTNVGHLEMASGMAGLFKAVLCIKHRAVPRTLHFETPNPAIDFRGLRLRVVDRYMPLEARGENGITVGVNSFGFGGTNVHVVLTEAPALVASTAAGALVGGDRSGVAVATIGTAAAITTAATAANPACAGLPALSPLVLTARAPQALAALAGRYLELLDAGHDWSALAAQTARRRQWLERRAIIAPADAAEGRRALAALSALTNALTKEGSEVMPNCIVQGQADPHADAGARVALVYSGNGSQWPGMGRQLYAENALFRAALDEVDALWRAHGNASLVEVMRAGASADWLAATENAQPLLFAIQVGVTRVLEARGIQFEATVGHSVGEIAAAWADGALTLAEAVRVIEVRSRAQALTHGSGRMAAVGLGEVNARQLIERLGLAPQVEVAGMNSPQSVTLAGSLQALEQIGAAARADGQFFQMLDLDYAFHSAHMERIRPVVLEQLADLAPRDGRGGYISTVTGERLAGRALNAGYWWRNIREPVRFGAAIARLADEGVRLFIEVGPHAILRTYIKQTLAEGQYPGAPLATLKRGHDASAELEQELLSAIAQGAAVDLDTFVPEPAAAVDVVAGVTAGMTDTAGSAGRPARAASHAARIPLPTYPWQHEHYWLAATPEGYDLTNRRREHPLLGYRLHDAAWAWENQIDPERMPMLADHVVDGAITFPGAGYIEMGLAAARAFFGTASAAADCIEIHAPVVFQAQQSRQFRLTIEEATARFRIETHERLSDGPWTHNVSGRLLASGAVSAEQILLSDQPDLPALLAHLRARPEISSAQLYALAADVGLAYGPAFRWVRAMRADGDMALAELGAPAGLSAAALGTSSAWMLHPALLDSGFHPLFAILDKAAYLPVQVGRADYLSDNAIRRVLVRIERRSPHSALVSFLFLDDQDAIVARLSACRARRIDLGARRADAPGRFAYALEARPLPGDFNAHALPAPAELIERAANQLAHDENEHEGKYKNAHKDAHENDRENGEKRENGGENSEAKTGGGENSGGENSAQRTHRLTEVLPLLDVLASLYALRALDAARVFARPPGRPLERLPERLSERLPGHLPECLPVYLPEHLSECLPERLPTHLQGAGAADGVSSHAALVARLAAMLVEDGLAHWESGGDGESGDGAQGAARRLVRDDEACARLPGLGELWRGLLADAPDHVAELTLLANSGTALARALGSEAGAMDAVAVVDVAGATTDATDTASAASANVGTDTGTVSGPAGKANAGKTSGTRASLVEHFFEASPTWRHTHRMMGACVGQALVAWREAQEGQGGARPNRRLRVLEIGATDSDVLHPLDMPAFAAGGAGYAGCAECDYVLAGTTHQLAGFDEHAYPGIRTLVWPLEDGAAASAGLAPFDVVLLRRALTTQANPLDVLDAVVAHLAPGGLVVVAEARRSRFADIVFGLHADDGRAGFQWNASGDAAAAQTPAGIAALLERAGLEQVAQHTEGGLELEGVPSFVIARKPQVPQASDAGQQVFSRATPAASARAPVTQWFVLHTGDSDASAGADLAVCATLAEALAQAGDAPAEVCALDEVAQRMASFANQTAGVASTTSASQAGPVCELVFVAPVASSGAHDAAGEVDGAAMMRAQAGGAIALARLVRALGGSVHTEGLRLPVRLSIITRGSAPFAPAPGEAAGRATAPLSPDQASLWGLGRTLANEYPEWLLRLIDAHPGAIQDATQDVPRNAHGDARNATRATAHGDARSATRATVHDDASNATRITAHDDARAALARQGLPCVDRLVAELLRGDEEEVVLNAHARWVPRMVPVAGLPRVRGQDAAAPATSPAVLAFEAPGSLRNLEWFALPEHAGGALEPDEVEIEPVATGLNFRDVMYAMGLLSDEAVENGFAGASVGMELSGRVTRVGRDAQQFAPGDAVLGFAPASFATRVRTRVGALAHKPSTLSFEAAATIPTTFFTAYYALVELARVRRGERVLVHGGAGGVGIAAIQIARHFGAQVFATAGSNEKREFVALLGADHVLDSRSLASADEIRALTRGEGVDIVLNSLAGEAMVRSIDTLRPFGRFLELGKRDFYENSQIGLRPFRNNISYFGIDADQLMGVLPALTARLFGEVMHLFGQGALHPLPYRAFPAAQVEDAFRYMQQARQIGKVLVTYPFGTPAPTRGLPRLPLPAFDPAGAYLIVGGTGGFGFATARWMIARGARHLTLASRSGRLDDAQRAEVENWRAQTGARVEAVACDASDARALAARVATVEARGTPLKGAVHSAMHIDDGLVRNLDDARFAAVLAPKVAGAWNLHRVLGARALDCFIVYSSATTYLGNPGQGSYVAANSFLEALVAMRRAVGLKANFMAWGPIEDVGFLARNAQTRDALQSRIGGASITSAEALAALDAVLASDAPGEAVVRLDWNAVARAMPAAHARRYARMHLRRADDTVREGGSQLRGQILALPPDEAQARAAEVLQAQIARILHLSPERIALDKSLLDMGMDSLMGMELGMAVEERFETRLSVMAIADGATVQSLAARIVASILAGESGGAPIDQTTDAAALVARHGLSDEERALLDARAPTLGSAPAQESGAVVPEYAQ